MKQKRIRPEEVSLRNWNLGQKIQRLRKKKGLIQEELSELVDVSVVWLSRVENGREVPQLEMLQRIAKVLKIKVSDLIPY